MLAEICNSLFKLLIILLLVPRPSHQLIFDFKEVKTDGVIKFDHPDDMPPDYLNLFLHPAYMNTSLFKQYMTKRNHLLAASRPGVQRAEIKPDVVYIDMDVLRTQKLDEYDEDIKVVVTLRQTWVDWRMNYERWNRTEKYLNYYYKKLMYNKNSDVFYGKLGIERVWKPDTYFVNERGAFIPDASTDNVRLLNYPNGTMYYEEKIVLRLKCELDFHKFPMDDQVCFFVISSVNYDNNDIIYKWNPLKNGNYVVLHPDLQLPDFEIKDVTYSECTSNDNPGIRDIAEFSCLKAEIHLSRIFSYYLIEVYLPSVLVVMISWINFFVDIEATPARVTLGLLTVLTISTKRTGLTNALPTVSYTKAVDVWMGFCLVIVLLAMVEFAIVNMLVDRANVGSTDLLSRFGTIDEDDDDELAKMRSQSRRSRRRSTIVVSATFGCFYGMKKEVKRTIRKMKTNPAYGIDVSSRILFPLCFLIFNVYYWIHYK